MGHDGPECACAGKYRGRFCESKSINHFSTLFFWFRLFFDQEIRWQFSCENFLYIPLVMPFDEDLISYFLDIYAKN